MIDLRKYAMFPESNNFLDSSTPGLEELERFIIRSWKKRRKI